MQDVWPPLIRLKVKARVADNDQTPVQCIMYGNQEEVLAEDVYTLQMTGSQ